MATQAEPANNSFHHFSTLYTERIQYNLLLICAQKYHPISHYTVVSILSCVTGDFIITFVMIQSIILPQHNFEVNIDCTTQLLYCSHYFGDFKLLINSKRVLSANVMLPILLTY